MIGMLRMVVVLSVLCGLSGFALSYLKMVTAPRIEEQVLTYVQGPALARVFTHTQNSPIADRRKFPLDHGSITVFPALRDGKLVGVELLMQAYAYPLYQLSLIHILRCRRYSLCRSRWSPYH